MSFEVGDKLKVTASSGAEAYGIFVGPRGPAGEDVLINDETGKVRLALLAEFAATQDCKVESRVIGNWQRRELVALRAMGLIGKQYDLAAFQL
jgi:hypothetical protein